MNLKLLPLLLLALVPRAYGELAVNSLFTHGVVLQRSQAVPVWGTASPGAKIDVAFAGQQISATADASGHWHGRLNPLEASATPRQLVVTGDHGTLTVENVVVGDVWLVSGQSNMHMPLRSSQVPPEMTAELDDPLIRFFKVANGTAGEPQSSVKGKWLPVSASSSQELSAVGYFFARELRKAHKVPVAIIHSAWGGTRIKVWTPLPAYEAAPPLQKLLDEWKVGQRKSLAARDHPELLAAYYKDYQDWEKNVEEPYKRAHKVWQAAAAQAKAEGRSAPAAPALSRPKPQNPDPFAGPTPGTYERPLITSLAYNAMIAPLAPFALQGVVWYQGEADSSNGLAYRDYLSRLIQGWRGSWDRSDLPFLVVQLPGYGKNDESVATKPNNIAWLREAQALTARTLPQVGLVVTADIGDPNDVHPTNKPHVGTRLALAARELVHREPGLVGLSPRYDRHEISGPAVKVSFVGAGSGLEPNAAPWVAPKGVALPTDKVVGFFLAGADKKWAPAEARIVGSDVVLTSAAISAPVAVRYAWASTPQANLYNREGLPVTPFRTDDWDAASPRAAGSKAAESDSP